MVEQLSSRVEEFACVAWADQYENGGAGTFLAPPFCCYVPEMGDD